MNTNERRIRALAQLSMIQTLAGTLADAARDAQDEHFPQPSPLTDADIAMLVGARPRGPGMERKDLLMESAKIFIEQGKALEQTATLPAVAGTKLVNAPTAVPAVFW